MNYSEHPSYMRYGLCVADDDLAGAKRALQECLDDSRLASDPIKQSDLFRRMAELYFEEDNRAEALRYYKKAESADPHSLLIKLYFARFLANKLGDSKAALAQCELLISLARARPFPESDDDFGSDEYIDKAEELKRALIAQ